MLSTLTGLGYLSFYRESTSLESVRWLDLQVFASGIAAAKPTGKYLRRPVNQATGYSRTDLFIFRGDGSPIMIVRLNRQQEMLLPPRKFIPVIQTFLSCYT